MKEYWKSIDNFSDYQISNFGKIKSLKFKKEKILKQHKNIHGRFYINLCKSGKSDLKYIHILVYETFNNYKLKDDECIHHIDFNPENNYYKNLKLMTISEHRSFHTKGKNHPLFGTHLFYGENNPSHKLEEWKVKAIHQISNSPIIKKLKITQKEIGEVFEISPSIISKIKNKNIWIKSIV